jgi:hypothetical protein
MAENLTTEELLSHLKFRTGAYGTRYDLGQMSITIRFDSPECVYIQKNGECVDLNLTTPELACEFVLAANDIIVKAEQAKKDSA